MSNPETPFGQDGIQTNGKGGPQGGGGNQVLSMLMRIMPI